MPNPDQLEQLRGFCRLDFRQALTGLAQRTGLGLEDTRDFIMSIPPALVVPRDRLTEFGGINPGILQLTNTLSSDRRVAKSPLNNSWLPIRHGKIGSEGLTQVRADIELFAKPYARAVARLYDQVIAGGYQGFRDALERNGYGMDQILEALSGIGRTRIELGLEHINHSADIRKNLQGESPALVTPDQMFERIAGNFPNGLEVVVYEGYGPARATSTSIATINDTGDAEMRFVLSKGPIIGDQTLVQEYAHIYYAIQKASEGKIPSALASTGLGEVFAKVMRGVDIGEALFFGSGMEAAYGFALHADSVLLSPLKPETKVRKLANAIAYPGSLLGTLTGFTPVESTTVVPFGPFSVAYSYDMVQAALLRPQFERQGITDPLEIYNILSK